jgi:hypothetical protein
MACLSPPASFPVFVLVPLLPEHFFGAFTFEMPALCAVEMLGLES